MAKPYDATTRFLVENHPEDWVRYLRLPVGEVETLQTDLSTVTADVDKVARVAADVPYLLHLEFQSGPDARLPARLLRYAALLHFAYDLPVETVLVLLRPVSRQDTFDGEYAVPGADPEDEPALRLRYRVLRVGEIPARDLLEGGLGLLPLAPVARAQPDEIAGVVTEMKARLNTAAISQGYARRPLDRHVHTDGFEIRRTVRGPNAGRSFRHGRIRDVPENPARRPRAGS
jgi:hypothetical protein